jgi:iron complex outermembrane receptor protein
MKVTQQLSRQWHAFTDIQWRHIGYDMQGTDDDVADLAQEHTYNFFNPKAGVTFAISQQQRAYASFAVGRREPTRADIKDAFKNGGTAMPRPETLYDVEAGYEQKNDAWTIGANLFYMYYLDQLVNTGKVSDSGYALMENVPESFRAGIELTFGVRPLKSLSINGNLAYSRNKIRDYVAYVDAFSEDWVPIPQVKESLGTTDIAFSPEWVGAADVSYEIIKGLSVGLTAKYVGQQYFDNTSNAGRRLDAYFVNNAIARYQIDFKKFYVGVQFAVNNIWNTDYISNAFVYPYWVGNDERADRSFFPQPYRNYVAKLTVGF